MKEQKPTDPAGGALYEKAYTDLQTKLTALQEEEQRIKPAHTQESQISDSVIDDFVTGLLNDPDINVNGLPDCAERVLYRKVLKIMLGAIGHMASTTDIRLVGHKLTIDIRPDTAPPSGSEN